MYNKLLEAPHADGSQCYGQIVIIVGKERLCWNRHEGCCLEAH